MYREIWNKYMKGFKFILPFIVVRVLYESISYNLGFSKYDFYDFFGGNLSSFKQAVVSNLGSILFSLFVGSLFSAFLMVVIKSLINDKDVNYGENLKESLGIYLRYLLLNIITSAIFVGILLLGLCKIIMPISFILLIYFNVILTPCMAYLVYNNVSPVVALKKGIAVGKKYSGEILLLAITLCIIIGIISGVSIKLKVNPVGSVFMDFIETSIWGYLYIFSMAICKKEEKVVDRMLESLD